MSSKVRGNGDASVQKLKLLIIEDDPDQRELMRETLEDHFGAGAVTTADSRAAALEHDLGGFDLILSDYNLPDANGLELLDDVRKVGDVPVIMVTGENVVHTAAEAIQRGATDYIVKVGDYLFTIPLVVEKNLAIAKVKRERETLARQLIDKNNQLESALKRVEELAATDPLTGLYNRRHFSRVLDQLFAEAQRYGGDLSCAMIDLDGYKQLNDTHGHQVGDQLLVLAGKVITANLRRMDIAARYGGDEFVLLLPHASSPEAAGVVQRIREEFRRGSGIILRRNDGVTMSVGVASLLGAAPPTADQLVAAADVALYRAKESGRNRIRTADTAAPTLWPD